MSSYEMERNGKRNVEESKENKKKICSCQIFAFALVCVAFFFLIISPRRNDMEEDETQVLIKMKDSNSPPTTHTEITSIPPPSAFLDVLTRQNDVMHRTV